MDEDKKNLEEKYLTLQLIDAQIKEIEKQLTLIEAKNQELLRLKESLSNLSATKPNSNTYSPLGLGIYASSKLIDVKKVLVNVGASILVKKDTADAQKMLDGQLRQSELITLQLTQNLQALATKAREVEKDIQKLLG